MSFGRVIDGVITFPYTQALFRQDFPNTSPPASFAAMSEQNRAQFGIVPVTEATPPSLDAGEEAVLGAPELVNGQWVRPWTVQPIYVESVTMRQARLALLGAGLLTDVDNAINAIEDTTQRQAALIEWEYAQSVDRDSPLVTSVLSAWELTEAEVNALFYQASLL
jgi:hypothetical protein